MGRPSSAVIRRIYVAFVLALAAGVAYVGVRSYKRYAKSVRASLISPQTDRFGIDRMRAVYPDLTDAERELLLVERSSLYLEYEAYTGYREKAFQGRYVTVSKHGFRQHGPSAWPPPKDRTIVYLFGGSTAFGYGVADDQTIAAHLETMLNAQGGTYAVYNFGRAGYYSTQERILFEQLVAGGFTPGIAVFLDGLNEFYNRDNLPSHYEEMYNYLDDVNGKAFRARPFAPAFGIKDKIDPFGPYRVKPEPVDVRESLSVVIRNWIANARIISAVSRQNDILTLFFWQPMPLYRNDLRTYLFLPFLDERFLRSLRGYPLFREMIDAKSVELPENFYWLADIQEERKDHLYLDTVHYTPRFLRDIASLIAEAIRRK